MKRISYLNAVTEALDEEMARDDKIFLIGEDIDNAGGVWAETKGLVEKYGKRRVVGTPISEAAFTGLAAGAAFTGLRPVVEYMYPDFIHVAMDQVASQIAKAYLMFGAQAKVPVVLRLCASGVGSREAAQHSELLEAWFAHLPGFKVVFPMTAKDGKGLMKSALRSDTPVVFLESRNILYKKMELPEEDFLVPIGQAEVIRPGKDLTIVSYGYARYKALEAAQTLEGQVDAEVIDLKTLKPLDLDTILASVRKTGRLLVAQEAPPTCSIGSEVIRRVVEADFSALRAAPRLAASKDIPIPFSANLEDYVVLQADDITKAARQLHAE